jgi:hypothetical protein
MEKGQLALAFLSFLVKAARDKFCFTLLRSLYEAGLLALWTGWSE